MGVAKLFGEGQTALDDIDLYVQMFVAQIPVKFLNQFRVFVCNNENDFIDLDHYVLMDNDKPGGVVEINVYDVAELFHKEYMELTAERRAKIRAVDKRLPERVAQIKAELDANSKWKD